MNTKFVVCIDSADWPESLEVRKIYRVLPDEVGAKYGLIRVIDDSDEDYLYPSDCFVAVELPEESERVFLGLCVMEETSVSAR